MRLGCFSMVAAALLALLAARVFPQAEEEPAAEPAKLAVVGLTVMAADPGDSWGRSFIPMFPPGVRLYLAYSDPGRTLLGLKADAFALTSLADDKGTDLAADGAARPGAWPELSEDRHRLTFSVETDRRPAAGAREIRLKAKVVVLAGAEPKTGTAKDVKLAEGTPVEMGAFKAVIHHVAEDTSDGKPARSVDFQSETGFAAIQKVAFLDAEGKPIESSEYGSSTGSDGDRTIYGKTWLVVTEAETVTIEVTWFDKVEEVVLPADFAVGVGL